MKVWKVNVIRKDSLYNIFPPEKGQGNNIAETIVGVIWNAYYNSEKDLTINRNQKITEGILTKTKRFRVCYSRNWRLIIKNIVILGYILIIASYCTRDNIHKICVTKKKKKIVGIFLLLRQQRGEINTILSTRGILKELSNRSVRIKK